MSSHEVLPSAGEMEHLLQAELWHEAHQLLCHHLGPQLFFASHTQEEVYPSQQQQQLESQLQHLISRLQPHADQIAGLSANRHSSAAHLQHASWSEGAGVYAMFYALRVRALKACHFDFGTCMVAP